MAVIRKPSGYKICWKIWADHTFYASRVKIIFQWSKNFTYKDSVDYVNPFSNDLRN